MATSLNALAREVTMQEGLREQVSIAQVKEILGVLGRRWRVMIDHGRGLEAFSEWMDITKRAGLRRSNGA